MVNIGEYFQPAFCCRPRTFPVDLVSLNNKLQELGVLEEAGGTGYVAALIDGVPLVSNVAHYAKIVKEKSKLRSIIHGTHIAQTQAIEEQDVKKSLDQPRANNPATSRR